jgi:hypothetical protein
MNIAFGAAYFGKIPAKRAMQDFGLIEMTSAEHFWYVVQNVFFGAGYFAKIPTAKALSELPQYRAQRQQELGTLSQGTVPLGVQPPPEADFPPPQPAGSLPSTSAEDTGAPWGDAPSTSPDEPDA